MMKIFLVCGVGSDAERNQAMLLFRQLSAWGNEVTLLDLSVLLEDSNESLSSYLCQMHLIHLLDLIEEAEATIITTNEQEGPLAQIIQSLLKMTAKGMLDGNRYVWNREGMNCILLGGSVKKHRVARQLWGILSNDAKLDLTDIFPVGEPKTYHIDHNRETAGPCAL